MNHAGKKENPGADVMSNSTMFTSPEVIDEAELKNVETNHTAMQDTLVGKYQFRRYQHTRRGERE